MKARIKETGEIGDVLCWDDVENTKLSILLKGSVCTIPYQNIEIIQLGSSVDWEQRRYELAKAAMQGLTSNSFWMKNLGIHLDEHPNRNIDAIEIVSIESINCADAMIKKLKGE